MPSSNPESIPIAVEIIWRLAPKSVVDIGAGYGKYGVLFREYLELRHREGGKTATTHDNGIKSGSVIIDAVEGFGEYINDVHKAVYDHIYVETVQQFLERDWCYDFVFMGDVLEHIEKVVATRDLLPQLVSRAKMGLLISVPVRVEDQAPLFGNELEIHRSCWNTQDFKPLAPFSCVGRRGGHLLAFLTTNGAIYNQVRSQGLRSKLRRIRQAMTDGW